MKGLVSALAAGSLLIFPLTAASQGRTIGHSMAGEDGGGGGGHVGGGQVGGGHVEGGHFGGEFHGGFDHGGFDHGRFGHGGFDHSRFHHFRHFEPDADDFFPFFGGFAFGLAFDPWFYGGYWGPWGPYSGHWSYDYYDSPYDYGSPPPHAAAPQACGQWDWRADQNRYVWTTTPCAGAPPAPAAPPEPPAPSAPPAPRG